MTIMTFKLRDSAHIQGLPKWNARIYKGEKFLYTPEEFFGETEEEAKLKARKFLREISQTDYQARMAELKPVSIKASDPAINESHHFAGKVWMRHPVHGFKRVDPSEVSGLEWVGWAKRGPRSGIPKRSAADRMSEIEE